MKHVEYPFRVWTFSSLIRARNPRLRLTTFSFQHHPNRQINNCIMYLSAKSKNLLTVVDLGAILVMPGVWITDKRKGWSIGNFFRNANGILLVTKYVMCRTRRRQDRPSSRLDGPVCHADSFRRQLIYGYSLIPMLLNIGSVWFIFERSTL
jgi:hypothetical protein